MARLNKTTREQIIENAIKKAGFPERFAKHNKKRAALIEKIRLKAIGGRGVQTRLEKLESYILSEAKKVPDDLVHTNIISRRNALFFSVGGESRYLEFEGSKIAPYNFFITATDPLAIELVKLEGELDTLQEERGQLRTKVEAMVYSVNTEKQLLEIWPEAEVLLPHGVPTGSRLPAVQTADLNAVIGLP